MRATASFSASFFSNLSYETRELQGFQFVNTPIFLLTLENDEKIICKIEIEINKKFLIKDEQGNSASFGYLNIFDSENKDLIEFIKKIYEFHGCFLEDFINYNDELENLSLCEIMAYVSSLSELELEIQVERNEFTYEILNLKEGNDHLKERL